MKKNKLKLIIISIILLISLSLNFIVYAAAPAFINRYRFSGGLYSTTQVPRKYYISTITQLSTTYINQIKSAASLWTTTKVYIPQTTVYMDSIIDVYGGLIPSGMASNTVGWTFWWVPQSNGTNVRAELIKDITANWVGAECYLSTANAPINDSDKQGVAAHEFGHAFGLNDNNGDAKSIMCQMGSGRSVTMPQSQDISAVNSGY